MDFVLDGKTYSIKLAVTDAIDELILGIDFLTKYAATWEIATGKLHLDGKCFLLQHRVTANRVRRLYSVEPVRIPARSQTDVPVRVIWPTMHPTESDWLVELKKRLTTAPILAMPTDGGGYVLDTDANATAAGCVLQQWQGSDLKVIGYASKSFSAAEVRYCTTRRELAAVMYGLYQSRHLLLGYRFLLWTDHAALTYLRRTPDPVGQSARYLDKLAEYDFELQHRPGAQHQNTDALSRRPCERAAAAPPCSQCRAVATRSIHGAAHQDDAASATLTSNEPPLKRRRHSTTKPTSADEAVVDPQGRSLLSKEMLCDRQKDDPVTGQIVKWLTAPEAAPSTSELTSSAPEVQGLYAQRDLLQLIDGVLYRNYERPDATLQFQQVVVPRCLRGEFLQNSHSGLINGHFGVEKTRERLRALAYWQGWNEDVRLFVARCQLCNQYRHGPRGKQGQLQPAIACAPMQKVHVDLTGPHVTSCNGYKYILTAICAFTKYLITIPIRDKTTKTVARALLKSVYLVHGPPSILVHDQGGEFWSQVMQDLADLLEIQVSKITSHRPQSNGVVERVHATIHNVFAKIVNTNQRNWCQLLAHVTYAYNCATHASSSFSPYYLLHSRHPRVPLELLIEKPTAAAVHSTDEYVQQTSDRMRQAYTVVREHLHANFERSKKRYDARIKLARFNVGDFVYYYVPRKHTGKNRKWALDNRGPFRIQRRINDVNYVIQKSPTSQLITVHIDRLTKYRVSDTEIPRVWQEQPSCSLPSCQEDDTAVEVEQQQVSKSPKPPDKRTRSRSGRVQKTSDRCFCL